MSTKINQYTRVFTVLLICFIVTSPLNNSYEVAGMMNGTLDASSSTLGISAWTASLTPVYIKALKDVFVFLTFLLMAVACIRSPRKARVFLAGPLALLNVFLLLLAFSTLYSLTFMPASIVLLGIRGYWSIIFIYAGALFYTLKESEIYPFVVAIFALDFVLQIIQFITDAGYRVYFNHRSPGFFMIPATAGAFALLVHYFGIRFNNTALKLGSAASLWLSNSTTGWLILVIYYIYTCRNKFKPKILFYPIYFAAIAAVGGLAVANLGAITGRGGGASYSALTRLGLIYVAFSRWQSLAFGQGMGIATSQALIAGYSNAVIADNTYLGIMYNAGILPALFLLVIAVMSFRYFDNKLLYFMLIGYSMSTVILEMNPVAQIALILLGISLGKRYSRPTPASLAAGP